jgi:RNA polymerase II subunit A-like phosphatase
MLTQNSLALEAQLEERPLAKKQEALQVASKDSKSGEEPPSSGPEGNEPLSNTNEKEVHGATSVKVEKVPRKALLKNDDTELERVSKVRTMVSH